MGNHQFTSKAIRCDLSTIESTSHYESMQPGTRVRLIHDPDCIGVLTSHSKMRGEIRRWEVVFPSGSRYIPEDQFECINSTESPVDLLRAGRLSGAADLRRTLTYVRLSGHLIDLIYSMETTNTDFYPYQFKPVLKMLNSPSNGLLVADEVGLGKTIEAGLIWTELRSRFDFRRLMVLCPSMLREKWRRELYFRFGIDARIVDARETLDIFRRARQDGPFGEFAIIGGMQGLRGSKRGGPANALMEFLNDQAYEEPLIDMLIIDEAHYLKNKESKTSKLGRVLRRLAEHIVLLSATPIHLGSEDLFQLLNLIDAETFGYADIFDEVLQANAPLVKARDYVLQTKLFDRDELLELLQKAARHDLLKNSRQLGALHREIAGTNENDHSFRSKVAYQLEEINLLGHTVTRTRKRDVQELRVVREPKSLSIPLSTPERELYERVTAIVRRFCESSDAHEGFLLVMPQRQLASSMPAALHFWKARNLSLMNEQANEQAYEDFGDDFDDLDEPGAVLTEIIGQLDDLEDMHTLRVHDGKYLRLLEMLKMYLSKDPDAKIVLFSYFRATLHYLSTRLREDGISAALLMGGMKDKDQVLEDFERPAGPHVLLSSEVASEGIDLQFSRVLINYDLPWNPMKVEQRIGRIDRLGQKADKIEIWNFFYENTIDQRIYDRLYERLKIFEYSLGGIEPILGEHIRELTLDLLGRPFTPEEEEKRIQQTAQALVNLRAEEERLEDEAAGLMAHGDYILQKVRESHETNRWVNAGDIQDYVIDFL